MIKELAGMTLEDAIMKSGMLFKECQKTGTLAGLMREYYLDPSKNAPKTILIDDDIIALNPDDFETDVDGYVALYAILINLTQVNEI